MDHEEWREHQRRSLGITDEQLECLLKVAKIAAVVTDGAMGYTELTTGMMMMSSLSASEIAATLPEYRCPCCSSPLIDADTTSDGEALWCAECGERVEFSDALEEASPALYAGCLDSPIQKRDFTGTWSYFRPTVEWEG